MPPEALRDSEPPPPPPPPKNDVQVTIVKTDDGIDIKIVTNKMMGTLHLSPEALGFSPPSTKKPSGHVIAYENLHRMISLSNGFTQLRESKK